MFSVFGRYGALRQVRVGSTTDTKGTAFIVYEDAADARAACEHLSGFGVGGRFLVVHFYHGKNAGSRAAAPVDLAAEAAAVASLRARVAAGDEAAAAAAAAARAAAAAAGDDDDALDDDADRRRTAALRR
jgi:RNA recognition motif-containing protein